MTETQLHVMLFVISVYVISRLKHNHMSCSSGYTIYITLVYTVSTLKQNHVSHSSGHVDVISVYKSNG